MSEEVEVKNTRQGRRALAVAAVLNVVLAIGLIVAGILADSSGLLANGLDNGSDVAVYVLALFAFTRGAAWKARAARVAGVMLLVLAVVLMVEVARRVVVGAEPVGVAMMAAALAAAAINGVCLAILRKNRRGDVNMRAAWIYSANDFLANGGVLVAGILVLTTGKTWPDLVVGLAVAAFAVKSGIDILRDAGHRSPD